MASKLTFSVRGYISTTVEIHNESPGQQSSSRSSRRSEPSFIQLTSAEKKQLVIDWDTLYVLGWRVLYSKDSRINQRESYVIPKLQTLTLAGLVENIEYFTDVNMKRHIDHNPVLLHGFWTVWKVLSQMGWQMRTEDGQQVYEFVCSDPIPGIHRFFSPETLLQYIGTFPYPLQEFDILAQTLQRHKWQIDDDSMELEFYHPIDGSKLSIRDIPQLLFCHPQLLFHSYVKPTNNVDTVEQRQRRILDALTVNVSNQLTERSPESRCVRLAGLPTRSLAALRTFIQSLPPCIRSSSSPASTLCLNPRQIDTFHQLLTEDFGWSVGPTSEWNDEWWHQQNAYIAPYADRTSAWEFGRHIFFDASHLLTVLHQQIDCVYTSPLSALAANVISADYSERNYMQLDAAAGKVVVARELEKFMRNCTCARDVELALTSGSLQPLMISSDWLVLNHRKAKKDVYVPPDIARNFKINESTLPCFKAGTSYYSTAEELFDHFQPEVAVEDTAESLCSSLTATPHSSEKTHISCLHSVPSSALNHTSTNVASTAAPVGQQCPSQLSSQDVKQRFAEWQTFPVEITKEDRNLWREIRSLCERRKFDALVAELLSFGWGRYRTVEDGEVYCTAEMNLHLTSHRKYEQGQELMARHLGGHQRGDDYFVVNEDNHRLFAVVDELLKQRDSIADHVRARELYRLHLYCLKGKTGTSPVTSPSNTNVPHKSLLSTSSSSSSAAAAAASAAYLQATPATVASPVYELASLFYNARNEQDQQPNYERVLEALRELGWQTLLLGSHEEMEKEAVLCSEEMMAKLLHVDAHTSSSSSSSSSRNIEKHCTRASLETAGFQHRRDFFFESRDRTEIVALAKTLAGKKRILRFGLLSDAEEDSDEEVEAAKRVPSNDKDMRKKAFAAAVVSANAATARPSHSVDKKMAASSSSSSNSSSCSGHGNNSSGMQKTAAPVVKAPLAKVQTAKAASKAPVPKAPAPKTSKAVAPVSNVHTRLDMDDESNHDKDGAGFIEDVVEREYSNGTNDEEDEDDGIDEEDRMVWLALIDELAAEKRKYRDVVQLLLALRWRKVYWGTDELLLVPEQVFAEWLTTDVVQLKSGYYYLKRTLMNNALEFLHMPEKYQRGVNIFLERYDKDALYERLRRAFIPPHLFNYILPSQREPQNNKAAPGKNNNALARPPSAVKPVSSSALQLLSSPAGHHHQHLLQDMQHLTTSPVTEEIEALIEALQEPSPKVQRIIGLLLLLDLGWQRAYRNNDAMLCTVDVFTTLQMEGIITKKASSSYYTYKHALLLQFHRYRPGVHYFFEGVHDLELLDVMHETVLPQLYQRLDEARHPEHLQANSKDQQQQQQQQKKKKQSNKVVQGEVLQLLSSEDEEEDDEEEDEEDAEDQDKDDQTLFSQQSLFLDLATALARENPRYGDIFNLLLRLGWMKVYYRSYEAFLITPQTVEIIARNQHFLDAQRKYIHQDALHNLQATVDYFSETLHKDEIIETARSLPKMQQARKLYHKHCAEQDAELAQEKARREAHRRSVAAAKEARLALEAEEQARMLAMQERRRRQMERSVLEPYVQRERQAQQELRSAQQSLKEQQQALGQLQKKQRQQQPQQQPAQHFTMTAQEILSSETYRADLETLETQLMTQRKRQKSSQASGAPSEQEDLWLELTSLVTAPHQSYASILRILKQLRWHTAYLQEDCLIMSPQLVESIEQRQLYKNPQKVYILAEALVGFQRNTDYFYEAFDKRTLYAHLQQLPQVQDILTIKEQAVDLLLKQLKDEHEQRVHAQQVQIQRLQTSIGQMQKRVSALQRQLQAAQDAKRDVEGDIDRRVAELSTSNPNASGGTNKTPADAIIWLDEDDGQEPSTAKQPYDRHAVSSSSAPSTGSTVHYNDYHGRGMSSEGYFQDSSVSLSKQKRQQLQQHYEDVPEFSAEAMQVLDDAGREAWRELCEALLPRSKVHGDIRHGTVSFFLKDLGWQAMSVKDVVDTYALCTPEMRRRGIEAGHFASTSKVVGSNCVHHYVHGVDYFYETQEGKAVLYEYLRDMLEKYCPRAYMRSLQPQLLQQQLPSRQQQKTQKIGKGAANNSNTNLSNHKQAPKTATQSKKTKEPSTSMTTGETRRSAPYTASTTETKHYDASVSRSHKDQQQSPVLSNKHKPSKQSQLPSKQQAPKPQPSKTASRKRTSTADSGDDSGEDADSSADSEAESEVAPHVLLTEYLAANPIRFGQIEHILLSGFGWQRQYYRHNDGCYLCTPAMIRSLRINGMSHPTKKDFVTSLVSFQRGVDYFHCSEDQVVLCAFLRNLAAVQYQTHVGDGASGAVGGAGVEDKAVFYVKHKSPMYAVKRLEEPEVGIERLVGHCRDGESEVDDDEVEVSTKRTKEAHQVAKKEVKSHLAHLDRLPSHYVQQQLLQAQDAEDGAMDVGEEDSEDEDDEDEEHLMEHHFFTNHNVLAPTNDVQKPANGAETSSMDMEDEEVVEAEEADLSQWPEIADKDLQNLLSSSSRSSARHNPINFERVYLCLKAAFGWHREWMRKGSTKGVSTGVRYVCGVDYVYFRQGRDYGQANLCENVDYFLDESAIVSTLQQHIASWKQTSQSSATRCPGVQQGGARGGGPGGARGGAAAKQTRSGQSFLSVQEEERRQRHVEAVVSARQTKHNKNNNDGNQDRTVLDNGDDEHGDTLAKKRLFADDHHPSGDKENEANASPHKRRRLHSSEDASREVMELESEDEAMEHEEDESGSDEKAEEEAEEEGMDESEAEGEVEEEEGEEEEEEDEGEDDEENFALTQDPAATSAPPQLDESTLSLAQYLTRCRKRLIAHTGGDTSSFPVAQRVEESYLLFDTIAQHLGQGQGGVVHVIGAPGTGKTLTVHATTRRIMSLLKQQRKERQHQQRARETVDNDDDDEDEDEDEMVVFASTMGGIEDTADVLLSIAEQTNLCIPASLTTKAARLAYISQRLQKPAIPVCIEESVATLPFNDHESHFTHSNRSSKHASGSSSGSSANKAHQKHSKKAVPMTVLLVDELTDFRGPTLRDLLSIALHKTSSLLIVATGNQHLLSDVSLVRPAMQRGTFRQCVFEPYERSKLFAILQQRAGLVFAENAAFYLIAKVVVHHSSDPRKLLEICDQALTTAVQQLQERNYDFTQPVSAIVTVPVVTSMYGQANKAKVLEFSSLHPNHRQVVIALLYAGYEFDGRHTPAITVAMAYEAYHNYLFEIGLQHQEVSMDTLLYWLEELCATSFVTAYRETSAFASASAFTSFAGSSSSGAGASSVATKKFELRVTCKMALEVTTLATELERNKLLAYLARKQREAVVSAQDAALGGLQA